MEKTTIIFIAGTTFSLTESAYEKLAGYIMALKDHFADEANREEIIRDIESRIAEKLVEKKDRMVVFADVEAIIAEIGQPSQFEDEKQAHTEKKDDTKGRKKLYRNMDDAWLGGVASSIATYFDIDPLWVRGGFVVATFAWGTSIVLYIALWVLVPEAKTTGQKLEMRGAHATFENIGRAVQERVEEVRERGSIKKFFDRLTHIVRCIFRAFGKIIGMILSIVPILAIIGLTIFSGAVLTNWDTPINDFPLRGAVPEGLIFLGVGAIYLAVIIPLALLAMSGVRVIRKRSMIPTSIVLVLIGMWVFVLIVGGIVGTTIARHYTETLATDPSYQIETRDLDLPSFTEVVVESNSRVTITTGVEQEVSVRARVMNHKKVDISVENGALFVGEDISRTGCFFCMPSEAEILITTPNLDKVSVHGARVYFDEYSDDVLVVDMSGGSLRGDLSATELVMKTENTYIRASINTDTLTINAKNTDFHLDGLAENAILYLTNSYFGTELFIIKNAVLDTQDSTNVQTKILNEVKAH